MKWIRSKINKDTIGSITKTVYNKTEWYRKNKFFNSMFFKYTVLFCITAYIAFLPFIKYHKSFMWAFDGQGIQYPALVYLGKWIRKIIRGVINGNFNIPLYDLNIALGSDIPQYLGMWYFEPLSFLSVLTPVVYVEKLYNFLAIFRLYLAGLSFIYLCRYLNKKNIYSVLGAIIYVFTGYVFFFMRHPIFFTSLIYFPLLIVELDKTMVKKRVSVPLAILVGISLFTSYYFLYINTLLCGIYFLVKIFSDKTIDKKFLNIINIILKIAISYLWGVAMSLFAFLPVFYSYLDSNRTGSVINTDSLFIYDNKWLPKLFVFMFTPLRDTGYWLYNGFSITTLLLVCLLFMKKGNTLLKRFLIITLLLLCFPMFTYIAHGFNSIHHRWNYVLGLLLGLSLVYGMDNLYSLEKKKVKLLFIPVAVYCFIVFGITRIRTVEHLVTCIFALLSFGVLYFIKLEDIKPNLAKILMTVLIVSSCGFNGYASYAPTMVSYVNDFIFKGTALNNQKSVSGNIEIKKDKIYQRRAEAYVAGNLVNNSLILNYMGIESYYSQRPKDYDNFNRLIENRAFNLLDVRGLDNRTFLDTLYNVKYYTTFPNEEKFLPFGYQYIYKELSGRKVYENKYALNFGYTYDKYITNEKFKKMSALERQEAMLTGVYLDKDIDDDIKNNLSEDNFKSSVKEVKHQVSGYRGAIRLDTRKRIIYVDALPAKMILEVETPKYAETYIRFNKLDMDNNGSVDEYIGVNGITDKTSVYKYMNVRSSKEIYNNRIYNFLVNLGYHEESVKNIEIDFPREGEYKIDDIRVYSQSMDGYKEKVEKLNQNYLKHVKWENNSLTGTIKVDKEKLMCLTVPYTKGWKAYVDGKEVKIYKANGFFSGILLSPGEHNIELKYFTPGLKIGVLISLIACVSLVVYSIVIKIVNKRKVNV